MSARRPPVLLGRAAERQAFDELLESVRGGQSAVLVIRGEAGIGKTALLQYCAQQASGFRVARIAGVESEMELPFAGLHQLCAPLLERLGALPGPQRAALGVALGLSSGTASDPFFTALAALSLLSEAALERPLLCVVDDAQWLDAASAQVLGFVARRLLAESVAIVFAVRDPVDVAALADLPKLVVRGLAEQDARALLAMAIPGRLEEPVRERLVAETHGNPLAIIQVPNELAATQFPRAEHSHFVPKRIEDSFRRRLEALSEPARRLLLVAAAEPGDDPLLIWRAAELLGLSSTVADETEGLLGIGERVAFLHPLVRSAVYRSASPAERRAVHRALAEATDPEVEADRRAWHRATAAPGLDEDVASELERSAGRAQARGGLGAAAAFLERSAALTPGPSRRAARLLATVAAKRDAGALGGALHLLNAINGDALDQLGRARIEALRGEIAFDQFRPGEAAQHLAGAARRLEPVAVGLARQTHLEALGAAMYEGDGDLMRTVAEAALQAPPPPAPARVSDALLDACAALMTQGHRVAAPLLRRALELVVAPADDPAHWLRFAVAGNVVTIAQELWDADAWLALAARAEQSARETGALVQLQFGLNMLAWIHVLAGEPARARLALDEEQTIAEATGNPSIAFSELVLAASLGQERKATELIDATLEAAPPRGRVACFALYARATLLNGLGRHDEALAAARSAFEPDHLGFGSFVVSELAEAASRAGDAKVLTSLLEWLAERTRATRTEWSLATEARVRALLSEGEAAETAYEEAIDLLGRTWLRPERARAQLLYGEWLRREGRRVDAREHLRSAHESLAASGMDGFAERASRELAATGEKVRKRTLETRDALTPQERQIAQLAREGLSNPEIGARLYLSPRTVEWHLKKVFTKLDISSRKGLHDALPSSYDEATPD